MCGEDLDAGVYGLECVSVGPGVYECGNWGMGV